MFDDLNVESYARFAYLELTKRIEKLRAQLQRLEDELHIYEKKLYLAETALSSFGLTPELLQQSPDAVSPISFLQPNRKLITLRGEEVRSKSELLIASILFLEKILYYYESTFHLGSETVTPDFLIPLKDEKYIIWEHLGLLEQDQYQRRWAWKKNLYTKHNYVENLNLIITKDTQGSFDTRDIVYMIQTYHLKDVAKPLNS